MTDPSIIIAVLCGLVVGLVLVLAITIAAYKSALSGRYAVIAAKSEVICSLHVRLNRLDASCDRANERLAVANARLAPFIAKRQRDAKGHFLPTVRSEAV